MSDQSNANIPSVLNDDGVVDTSYYKQIAQQLNYKDKSEMSYGERHAVRHMRHARDKEYSRLAFQLCNDFSSTYATCCAANSYSAAWTCRRPLQELKACINRHIIAFNKAEADLNTLPATPKDLIDYHDLVHKFEEKQQKIAVADQYRIEREINSNIPPSF